MALVSACQLARGCAALTVALLTVGCGDRSDRTPTSSTPSFSNATSSPRGPAIDVDLPGFDWKPDRSGGPQPKPCGGMVLCVGPGAAFSTISDAVGQAKAGDIVQVAAGRYQDSVLVEGKQVTLLGGFTADFSRRDPGANETIIDAGGRSSTVILAAAGDSTVDGFTITGGKAAFNEDREATGSGILVVEAGAVTISRNLIVGNDDGADDPETCDCSTFGGGLTLESGESATISDNIVRNNAAHRGGGMSVGIRAVIERNLVEHNRGRGDHGGGLYLSGDGTIVRSNLVRGNVVGEELGYGWGGGGIFYGDDVQQRPKVVLEGNRWVGNEAFTSGSGFFIDEAAEGAITGDLFYANACHERAAGLYLDGGSAFGSAATVNHVTITGGKCGPESLGAGIYAEGGSRFDLSESIVAGNGGADEVSQCAECPEPPPAAPATVTDSIVGKTAGLVELRSGVEQRIPQFKNPEAGDFTVDGTTWGAQT